MSSGPLDVTLPELSVGPSVAGIDGSGGMTTIPALAQDAQQAAGPDYGFSSTVEDAIAQAAARHGVPLEYMRRMANIESRGDPTAVSSTGARGLFQFTGGTAQDMGLRNRDDPYANADAAARLTLQNQGSLQRALGRAPTQGELYLAHQQGAGGARDILSDPGGLAVDAVGRRAVVVNGGNPGMTNQQFAGMWTNKFPGGGSTFGQGTTPGAANPGMSAGSTAMQGGFGLGGIQAQGAPVAGQAAPPGVPSLAAQPMTALGPTASTMMPGRQGGAAPASQYGALQNLLQNAQGLQQGLGGLAGAAGGQGQQRSQGGGGGASMGSPGGGPSPIGLQQARALFDPSRFFTALRNAGVRNV